MTQRRTLIILFLLVLLSWGGGRAYYAVTDGFTLNNIVYDLPYEVRREVKKPSKEVRLKIKSILDQEFKYLDKGCQSYVFESSDGKYVLKFLKFQRYRPQKWLEYLTWVDPIKAYSQERYNHKKNKLDKLFSSWKVAYEDLSEETGLIYVHLSAAGDLEQTVTFYDKIGVKHTVDIDQMQFLIQHKTNMLCPTLQSMTASGRREEARQLLSKLIDLFMSEYKRGYADFDPAIMQNTGVINGSPIHVDVGQITQSNSLFDENIWKQDLFDKTYKFRIWLQNVDQELCSELEARLHEIIGDQFYQMTLTIRP